IFLRRAPGRVEVVLRSRAVERGRPGIVGTGAGFRPRLYDRRPRPDTRIRLAHRVGNGDARRPVDEDHVVAFAVPVPEGGAAAGIDVEEHADIVAVTLRFQNRVIVLAVHILAAEQELLVGKPGLFEALRAV